jgi:predicted ATPase
VGRRRELATLQALLRQVQAGRGQVVGVIGESGIGKSRLVYEFHQSLHGHFITYRATSCLSHGVVIPYLPILAVLRQHCGVAQADPLTTVAAKVHASLREVGLEPDDRTPYLLHLLEVPAGVESLAGLSPQVLKSRTLDILLQLVLQGARRRPLLLEVENLHWIDPNSEEVLAALVERFIGARSLLLLTYRLGYRPPWIEKSYATQMALAGLAPRDSRRLVQAVIRTAPVPEALVQAILAQELGHPFSLAFAL